MDAVESRMSECAHLADIVAGSLDHPGLRAIGIDREDLSQVALIALWHAAADYREGVGAWPAFALYHMRRDIIDEVRRLGGRERRLRRMHPLCWEPAQDADVLVNLCRGEDRARLLEALRHLPLRWRYVMVSRMLDVTRPAIARGLGVSVNYIDQLIHAASALLRRHCAREAC